MDSADLDQVSAVLNHNVLRRMLRYLPDAFILKLSLVCKEWYNKLVPTYFTIQRNRAKVEVRESRESQLSTLDFYRIIAVMSPDVIPFLERYLLRKYVPKPGYHIKPFP